MNPQDPLADLQELLASLDPGPASPAKPLSEEERAAINRFLEVEQAELDLVGRTTPDPAR